MSPPKQQQQAKHELPRATVASAVSALTKWMHARAAEAPPNLLADERDDLIVLQLSLRRIPASPTTKPHLLQIPHPVLPLSSASVCVISDDRTDSRSPAASAILDAAKSLELPVSEVIPFSTLRTDYRPYESRRRFAASHDLFLADRALLPMLPRVLGKAFYSTKKAPIAVDFTRVGWPEQVRKVVSSTFLYLRSGTCSVIKVGRLDMKDEEIVENVMAAAEAAVEKVPKKWANVRAMHLKAVDSVALPIYQVVPELGMKIEVPVGRLEGEAGAGEVIDAAEGKTRKKRRDDKKKALKNVDANVGGEVAKEESGKRKRNKKEQTEDLVMEEVQAVTEKRRRKESASSIEVSADKGLKIAKKGKEKKRALDKEVEDAIVEKKKGKSEHTLEDASSKKGKKEDNKLEDASSKKGKKEGSKLEDPSSKKGKKEDSKLEDASSKKGKKEDSKLEDASSKKGKKEDSKLEDASSKKGKKEDSKHAVKEADHASSKKNKGKKGDVKEGKIMKGNSDDGEILMEEMKSKGNKSNDSKMKRRTRARV